MYRGPQKQSAQAGKENRCFTVSSPYCTDVSAESSRSSDRVLLLVVGGEVLARLRGGWRCRVVHGNRAELGIAKWRGYPPPGRTRASPTSRASTTPTQAQLRHLIVLKHHGRHSLSLGGQVCVEMEVMREGEGHLGLVRSVPQDV